MSWSLNVFPAEKIASVSWSPRSHPIHAPVLAFPFNAAVSNFVVCICLRGADSWYLLEGSLCTLSCFENVYFAKSIFRGCHKILKVTWVGEGCGRGQGGIQKVLRWGICFQTPFFVCFAITSFCFFWYCLIYRCSKVSHEQGKISGHLKK